MSRASLMSSSSWYSSSCCCILARISAISRSFSASSRRLVSRSRASESSRSRSFASLAASWAREPGSGEIPGPGTEGQAVPPRPSPGSLAAPEPARGPRVGDGGPEALPYLTEISGSEAGTCFLGP